MRALVRLRILNSKGKKYIYKTELLFIKNLVPKYKVQGKYISVSSASKSKTNGSWGSQFNRQSYR